MKCTILPASEKDINAFLSTNPKIGSKHVVPSAAGNPHVIFFYEDAADAEATKTMALVEQNAQIEGLIDTARHIAADKEYAALKNAKQREVYLLTRHNVQKADADTVMALLSPEMAGVLGSA